MPNTNGCDFLKVILYGSRNDLVCFFSGISLNVYFIEGVYSVVVFLSIIIMRISFL